MHHSGCLESFAIRSRDPHGQFPFVRCGELQPVRVIHPERFAALVCGPRLFLLQAHIVSVGKNAASKPIFLPLGILVSFKRFPLFPRESDFRHVNSPLSFVRARSPRKPATGTGLQGWLGFVVLAIPVHRLQELLGSLENRTGERFCRAHRTIVERRTD